jgi:hypothetical protein
MLELTSQPATTSDAVEPLQHVSRIGRRRFIQGVGAAAAAGALTTVLHSTASAAGLAEGASQFVPLPVVKRVIDTRDPGEYEFTRFGPNHVRIPIRGRHGVPDDAVAIAATLTTVNPAGGNWLTIVPAGVNIGQLLADNKLASALNMSFPNEAVANLSQVKLSADGVELYSLQPCEMLLDLIGYYRPVTGPVREGRFVGLESARRAIDTRDTFGFVGSGQTLTVDLTDFGVPDDASGVVVNLTATECLGAGYFTVYPSSATALPKASSLNVNVFNETRAAAVLVPISTIGGRRTIKVFAQNPAKLIVDVTGYFTSVSSALAQEGLFVPADPVRILDTRDPGQIGKLWPRWFVEGAIPAPGASQGAAAVVNLTGVQARDPGFLTISAARAPLPPTSNLNFTTRGQVVPNHAITPVTQVPGAPTTTSFQVYSNAGAHVVVDYLGFYTGAPALPKIAKPVNPPPPPIGPEWTLSVPRIGLVSRVQAGDPNTVTDRGNSWHWTGTGYMGQEAHVGLFGHRTEHGGPYRRLNELSEGDQLIVTTGDGRQFVYEVVRRDLTDSATDNILEATRFQPGTTLSLIACSRPDFTPTSLKFRIVVTAVLVNWFEL